MIYLCSSLRQSPYDFSFIIVHYFYNIIDKHLVRYRKQYRDTYQIYRPISGIWEFYTDDTYLPDFQNTVILDTEPRISTLETMVLDKILENI